MSQPTSSWRLWNRYALPQIARRSAWALDTIGALAGLVLLLAVFAFMSPSFRQVDNLMLIATEAATIGIVAVGQTLVLLTGGIDLSVSSIVALTGLVTASLMKRGLGPIGPLPSYLAISLGLALGAAIGAAQGWLIANRRMPPFIVTLGTLFGLRGLTLAFSNEPLHLLPDDFKWISDGALGPLPAPALIMLAAYGSVWYILRNTKFGRYCYAIGGNETAARLSGVNVERHKTYVYALNGLLAALAGMILIASIDVGIYTNGENYELYSLAAAIIGGTSLSGGMGGVWGTLIGVLIITVIPNGMTMLNAPLWWRNVITGAVILLAVLIDIERQRVRKPVPRPIVEASALTGNYLSEVLSQLATVVKQHMGTPYSCVYLVDRDTGDLVQQSHPWASDQAGNVSDRLIPERTGIAAEAKETGQSIHVPDIRRSANRVVAPMHPDVQSALALPLSARGRVVGVIEIHSTVPDAFRNRPTNLFEQQLAWRLEDAWLLENGWLVRQLRDVLRHLWDDLHLGRSALAEWALHIDNTHVERTPAARGVALRTQLLALIDGLSPEAHDQSRPGRGQRILRLTYADERSADAIAHELHISRRQYFYDLKESLEALADAMVREHQAKLQAQAHR